MKKIISFITLLLILSNNLYFITNAVSTNELSSPWTIEKAEHLAKKALFGASKEKVQELFNAGSASSAVNILFPSINGPDRTTFNEKMTSLLDTSWLIETSKSEMRDFYTKKRMDDPYEAKAKLHGLFEDTFSVNTKNGRINYGDIESTYDLLYSNTLGNYKEMVKRNLYNNGMAGDYSLGEYLDLFNQKNPSRPNENYSREMVQLFLMLEYKPTESEDLGSTRNYTEDDVQSLARILFGFEADENTHMVTYNTNSNTNTNIEFLDGDLNTGDSFPFYNSASGTIDIQIMKTSIDGNNGLPDNTVDYIFSKREEEIAIFLADKLYRFYVAENPSRADLDIITSEIINNNFEIFPTVKWLLENDIMYSEKSMNDVIYKNPLELVIGTSKILGLNTNDLDFRYNLINIGWNPYGVGKIFGRDGYDDNTIFFTPYIANKWTTESATLAYKLTNTNLSFLTEQNNPALIVEELENKLYLGKSLDTPTKQKLIKYLTHDKDGNVIVVDFTDKNYVDRNIQGLIYIMLNLPEYVLQSGYDISTSDTTNNNSFYNSDSKLVLIKASGGLDWLHAIIQKDEYNEYLQLRSTGALTGTGIISLNDTYYINSSLAPFKGLYDSGNLKIINRVGTPNHSRGHDSASRKVTSIDSTYDGGKGILGNFISDEDPSKTIVLAGSTKPPILDNGNYMGIGSSALFNIVTATDKDEKKYKIDTLKDLLINRTYIGTFGNVFKNSAIIDSVARDSVANGGREGSGYNMKQKFTFLESLYKNGLGNTAWLRADGGYDTHRNEKYYLNSNFSKVSKETTDFFNRVKNDNNITIVIYSEFGRTNKLNSSLGLDHGEGGGMFIISNNNNLIKKELPKEIYGNNSFKDAISNWLGVGIDYRSVYTAIFKALYNKNISNELGGVYNINDYIDKTPPKIQMLNIDYNTYSATNFQVKLHFDVDDKNFLSSEGSYVKFEYWSDTMPIREVSRYSMYGMRLSDKDYRLRFSVNPGKKYYYRITTYDNQYNINVVEKSIIVPKNSVNINPAESVFMHRFLNRDTTNKIELPNNNDHGIVLAGTGKVIYIGDNDSKILVNSGTFVTEINGGTGILWDGFFMNPTEIGIDSFIGSKAVYNGNKLSGFKIGKIVKIGAQTLGVGLKLNKEVGIEISNIDSDKNYIILTSEDGINWLKEINPQIVKGNNTLRFQTNHFSYFAVIQTDSNGNPIISNTEDIVTPVISSSGGSGGGSTPRQVKDVCAYGDFSASYYDRTCGIDPYLMHAGNQETGSNGMYIDMYNDLKNDLKDLNSGTIKIENKSIYKTEKEMELAYLELRIVDEDKAEIYEKLFEEELRGDRIEEDKILNEIKFSEKESQINILTLLREKMSFVYIDSNKLVHIKNSKLNETFEKIGKLIINKNFSENKIKDLFNKLNKVIIYSAINDLKDIDIKIKSKNKILLKQSIQILIKGFKKESKKEIVPAQKTETIREKIIRINAKKKAIKDSMK